MSALKKVKEQPLLTVPPGERMWWEVNVGDLTIMGDSLAALRKDAAPKPVKRGVVTAYDLLKGGVELARHLYCMKGLNTSTKVTPEDEAVMRADLEVYRSMESDGPHELGGMLVFMRGAGVDVEVKAKDLETIRRQLRMGPYEEGGDTITLWRHYYLKTLGQAWAVKGIERAVMEQGLKEEKRFKRGDQIAVFLSIMRHIGIPVGYSESDKKSIWDSIERFRAERDGQSLAQTLYFLKELMPARDAAANEASMPPLRRFRER